MSNFGFLAAKDRYALFSAACIEAEKIYATSPAMCAVGCRKALELAVKWVGRPRYADALQGQFAGLDSRAELYARHGVRHLAQAAICD